MNTQLSPQSSIPVIALTPYEEDDYTWTLEQIDLLRRGQLDKIDAINIAEEMELVMDSVIAGMLSKLSNLLAHMLKWEYQPELRRYGNSSWEQTIRNSREDIYYVLHKGDGKEKKGVVKEYHKYFSDTYQRARKKAARETRMSLSTFPEVCTWTYDQIIDTDLDFFPGVPVETPPVEKKRSQRGKRKR